MSRTPHSTSRSAGEASGSCGSIASVVEAYLDGECDRATALRVLAHLEACDPCAEETRALEAIKQALVTGRCCSADPEVVANLRAYAKHLSRH